MPLINLCLKPLSLSCLCLDHCLALVKAWCFIPSSVPSLLSDIAAFVLLRIRISQLSVAGAPLLVAKDMIRLDWNLNQPQGFFYSQTANIPFLEMNPLDQDLYNWEWVEYKPLLEHLPESGLNRHCVAENAPDSAETGRMDLVLEPPPTSSPLTLLLCFHLFSCV